MGVRILWFALSIAAGMFAGPQEQPEHMGPGVTPPRVVSKQEPQYTEQARIARLMGSVQLSLVVSAQGKATQIQVKRGMGLGLDEEAVRTVADTWQFAPGMKAGSAVPVFAMIEVTFRLLPGPQPLWGMRSASFEKQEGMTPPVLKQTKYPKAPEASGNVKITFDVDEKGSVSNIQGDEPGLVAALKNWKFAPAMKDGKPVAASATFTFFAE